MRNRATATRIVIIAWLVLAVAGDIGLALAPIPPGQASDLASNESFTIQLLALIGWPIFSAVLAALFFTLVVNRLAPPTAEVSADALRLRLDFLRREIIPFASTESIDARPTETLQTASRWPNINAIVRKRGLLSRKRPV